MPEFTLPSTLPAVMGLLCQERAEGVLLLDQNDGHRRLYWQDGNLVYLQSDVAGEQFGNYLLRQGILDFAALNELLANEERFRLGEKVVQWGLMSVEERDLHLGALQEQVMIHALEHTIVQMDWKPGEVRKELSDDLYFRIDHRHFVWNTFLEAHNLPELCDTLYEEKDWRWVAPADLLESLSDLPLTPAMAYALSFLGTEPLSYGTFGSLSGLGEEDAARLLMTLWGLGGLRLVEGAILRPAAPALPPPPPTPQAPLDAPELAPTPAQPLAMPALEFTPRIDLDLGPVGSAAPPPLTATEIPSLPEMPLAPPPPSQEAPGVRAKKCFLKAKSLLMQERTVEAVRLLEQSVKLEGEADAAYEPWLLLGRCRLANPAWSTRAVEALQAASRLRPRSAEPWALMGELYHRKGFKANASACFRKALELDPSVPVPTDVNLKEEVEEPTGFFGRFKAMLGRNEKD